VIHVSRSLQRVARNGNLELLPVSVVSGAIAMIGLALGRGICGEVCF
jgi:hypothetical protein